MILLVLLLLCTAGTSLGDEAHYYPPSAGGHGATVCIEIRPAGHQSPTKVCGPVVHGSGQQHQQKTQQQAQQQRSDPGHAVSSPDTVQRVDPGVLQLGDPKEAGPPCNRGFPRFAGPMYIPRSIGDGLVALGQPMELDTMGWRQATPPCPHEQAMRAMAHPMMSVGPMLPMQPPLRGFPPSMIPRAWLTPPAFRSAEEQEPVLKGPEVKEEYEHLLKECDEKTKMIKEKDMEIAELKGKMSEIKQDSEKPKTVKTQNVSQQQMKN